MSVHLDPFDGELHNLPPSAVAAAGLAGGLAPKRHPGYISGNWYNPFGLLGAGSARTTGTVCFAPFLIEKTVTISDLTAYISTAVASGNLTLAIYASNLTTGRPTGAALATTGALSTAATGAISAGTGLVGGNKTLEPGLYWAAYSVDATAGSGGVVISVPPQSVAPAGYLIGSTSLTNLCITASASGPMISTVLAYTTSWPDMTAATFVESTTSANNGPAIKFKVA